MTLAIPQEFVDAIIAQAYRELPNEACGVILGPAGSGRAEKLKPMVNAAASPVFYEFAPTDLLSLYRGLDDNDEEIMVVYHSHPTSEAHPSSSDIAYAGEPGAHYVLVSTREEIAPKVEFRSFRIVDGTVTEEEVLISPKS
jgi:proteasome lid subunit RPN8/RPN11